jgi:iron-sulfur cluster assembly protein
MATTTRVLFRETKDSRLRASPGAAPAAPAGDAAAPAEGIAITEAAAAEIMRQRARRGTPDAAIRVGLRGGGCSGFSYVFDWDDGPPREGKDRVFAQHGVTLHVDHKSFKYLEGTELDFVTSMMGYGFRFNNPNAKGSCGCGESVQF